LSHVRPSKRQCEKWTEKKKGRVSPCLLNRRIQSKIAGQAGVKNLQGGEKVRLAEETRCSLRVNGGRGRKEDSKMRRGALHSETTESIRMGKSLTKKKSATLGSNIGSLMESSDTSEWGRRKEDHSAYLFVLGGVQCRHYKRERREESPALTSSKKGGRDPACSVNKDGAEGAGGGELSNTGLTEGKLYAKKVTTSDKKKGCGPKQRGKEGLAIRQVVQWWKMGGWGVASQRISKRS